MDGKAHALSVVVHYSEQLSLVSSAGAVCCMWCCRKFFKKGVDPDDDDWATGFGCCLEQGKSVRDDIKQVVLSDRKTVSQIWQKDLSNVSRAVKYYHLAADLTSASAQSSFGISLE
jgi:hypothetical protein